MCISWLKCCDNTGSQGLWWFPPKPSDTQPTSTHSDDLVCFHPRSVKHAAEDSLDKHVHTARSRQPSFCARGGEERRRRVSSSVRNTHFKRERKQERVKKTLASVWGPEGVWQQLIPSCCNVEHLSPVADPSGLQERTREPRKAAVLRRGAVEHWSSTGLAARRF